MLTAQLFVDVPEMVVVSRGAYVPVMLLERIDDAGTLV